MAIQSDGPVLLLRRESAVHGADLRYRREVGLAIDDLRPGLRHRVRPQLADEAGVSAMAMFGRLALRLNGCVAVGPAGGGELIVRVAPGPTHAALVRPHTRLFEFARTLPPKG